MKPDPAADLLARARSAAAERPAGASGRAVGVLGRYVPMEILAALGADPMLMTSGATRANAQEGEALVRADSCALCRSFLGAGRTGLLAAGSACDQQRRTLEIFGRRGGDVLSFGVPRTASHNARERYIDAVLRLAGEVGRRLGTALQPETLRTEAARYAAMRARLKALRPRLSFSGFLQLTSDCFLLGAERALAILDDARLPERPGPAARLFLAGSCLAREDASFVEILDPLEADIVDDLAAFPGAMLDVSVPIDADDAREVIAAYFDQPDIGRRPNDDYYDHLRRRVAESGAHGVIFRHLRFCDLNAGEKMRVKEALAPLPVLFLDDEHVSEAEARTRTRLEALLEGILCRQA